VRLLIVESPTKSRKLREFLPADIRIAASYGHVRDLPPSGDLAVSFRDGRVLPTYAPLEKATRAIAELRSLAAQAEEILLATDPDREGEAIAWHLTELIGPHRYQRAVFHALTRTAVLDALNHLRPVDQHLVDAQQARRVLDRVVGWVVSPTLRRLGKDARSAGRVQSIALRIVADREREIAAFTARDYFTLTATVQKPEAPPPFQAHLAEWKGEALGHRLAAADVAEKAVAWCRKQPFIVGACDRREQARHPPPPFTTATVQQAASVRLKLAPDQTMKLLQELFEGGHITYHRTDSTALAPEAITEARMVISARFSARYLPEKPVIHATKAANAQEAHEAIRPTHADKGPDAAGATPAGKLHALIWERFIACQMASGRDELTTIDVHCAPDAWQGGPMGIFRAKGKVVRFDGWRKLGGDATDEAKPSGRSKAGKASGDDDEFTGQLPLLEVGQPLDLQNLAAVLKSTKPPPRYTQAALIKRLERDGIGRPSTYAAILGTILFRGYVVEKKRLLHASPLGLQVTDFLVRHYAGGFIELDYTARLEGALDQVARGERAWEPLVTAASRTVVTHAQNAGYRGDPLAG